MKRLIIMAMSLANVSAFAQKGFFLQPEAGIGTAGIHANFDPLSFYPGIWMQSRDMGNVSAFNVGFLAGYEFSKIQITAGISYMTSGYAADYDAGDFILIRGRLTDKYRHIAVPVSALYKLALSKKVLLMPGLGAAYSYNISDTRVDAYSFGNFQETDRHTYSGKDFHARYAASSIWSTAQVNVAYKFSSRVNILAGPRVAYTLTPISQNADYPEYVQRNFVFSFDAGVQWKIHGEKKSPEQAK